MYAKGWSGIIRLSNEEGGKERESYDRRGSNGWIGGFDLGERDYEWRDWDGGCVGRYVD